MFRDNF